MKHHANGWVTNRVLKQNVGFLLNAGPGHSHKIEFDVPAVRVAEDVDLNYLRGQLRLSRAKEGVLVQGVLSAGIEDDCIRCLDTVAADIQLDLEELYTYPNAGDSEFYIADDAVLDLSPLVRAEVLIVAARGVLCREDCQGICAECGANRNYETCNCDIDDIDPRLAKLKELLDAKK